ncbi:MAG: M3 family oligoendopeptidase, partial [Armatimonadetes bacterium]|nr:M3 family oligoendopeptidase [Armatimonadota bacterium]
LNVFYKNPDDYRRSYITTLYDAVLILPWVATIDAFQHWIYTHTSHTREGRRRAWLEIHERFEGCYSTFGVADWTELDEPRAYLWHRQLHLYTSPFYYIEYGIAQIGALQVWVQSRRNHREAVERYWQALALGGSRPLPELFEAAGAKFRFDEQSVKPLMETVAEELERLEN